jgi:hypothetical protein
VRSYTPWRVRLNRRRTSRVPQRYSYSLTRYDSLVFASWNIFGIASILDDEISNHQYSKEDLVQVGDSAIGKETQGDTEEETQKPHDPRTRRITRESSSAKSPKKKKTNKKRQKNRKKNSQTSPSQVISRKGTPAGTQESRRQTQSPTHSAEDPKSRACKSVDQLAREFVAGNQKIARELGLLAPERNSFKPQYLKRRTKTRIDECHRLHQIVNRTAIRANAGDKEAKAVLTALQAQHEEAIKRKKKLSREDKREDRNRKIASLAKSMLESTNEDETWRYIRSRLDPPKKCLGLTPIVYEEALRTESASVNEAWTDHGTELHEDATGHCRNRIYWHQYAAKLQRLDPVPEWNDPIFWPESVRPLLCSSNRKAPGIDGIAAEWMKLATPKHGTTGTPSIPDEPDTSLGKRLLELIQRMFEEAYIPDIWRTVEVVPILKKDSDIHTHRHEQLPDYAPHTVNHEAILRHAHEPDPEGPPGAQVLRPRTGWIPEPRGMHEPCPDPH